MKRKKPLVRSTPIPRGKPPVRKTRIPKVNVERQKKARARYAKKLQAYKRSETFAEVEARSNGQCELYHLVEKPGIVAWISFPNRCAQAATDHHHKTYARFGGKERSDDILHVCKDCHALLESQKPAGNRRSRLLRGLAN